MGRFSDFLGTIYNTFKIGKANIVASGLSAARTITIQNSSHTLVGRDTTDDLTNKTLIAPKISSGSHIADANGNELIKFPSTVSSAVNEITVTNAATGNKPTISATGGDTNISINLVPKGNGTVQINGVEIVLHLPPKTLADNAPVDIDVSDGSTKAILSTGSSRELNFSAAGARDMHVLTVRIDNTSGSSITPTLNTSGANDGRFGSDFTALPTIAAGKTAYLTFIYHDGDDRWDYLGDTKGF